MINKRHFIIAICILLVITTTSLTFVGASWSQTLKAGGSFESANIDLNIDLNGVDPDPVIVDLGKDLTAGDSGVVDLTMTNTGTVSENVTVSLVNIPPDFLGIIINNDCPDNLVAGGTCEVKINWLIQNTDSADGRDFSISLKADVNHGGWKVQKTIKIEGKIALSTSTPTITETEVITEIPTATETLVSTEEVVPTEEAIPTDAPINTLEPSLTLEPTEEVSPTEEAIPTDAPIVVDTPEQIPN
jgi:hypothetical protein